MNVSLLPARVYEIEVLILYAESMLPQIVNEKKLILEEKFQTETLLQKCDTWLGVCIDGLSCLDKKLEDEVTRDDEATIEIRKVSLVGASTSGCVGRLL